MPNKFLYAAPLLALTLAACSGPVEDTLPGQPIKHRQDAFNQILLSFEPMGVMLRTNRYQAEPFLDMATRLVELREGPWAYFTAGSFQPPTRAKEAVWARADAFEHQRQAFIDATDALLQAAHSGELDGVRSAYAAVEATCRSCHADYRN